MISEGRTRRDEMTTHTQDEVTAATLTVWFRIANGKRFSRDFGITAEEATDPLARANRISLACAYGSGRGWRLVNWTVTK